jgi:hypothetical protein
MHLKKEWVKDVWNWMPSFISNCPKDVLARALIVGLGGYENPLQTPIGYTHLTDMG